ncbi:MAG: ShlB/FhaC/HecB family hemolysin secretion/activation protein [Candidatus Omnitrophica bacterium]|nr:ShlB/FhaC/HecB family hemolysin secretion/activation protein [Candidatus Omnitrophota bacterium]
MKIPLICLILTLILFPAPARAQVTPDLTPGATQGRYLQNQQYFQQHQQLKRQSEQREEALIEQLGAPDSPAARPAAAARFRLRGVRATPSRILSDDDIDGVVGRYIGREVTLADLNRMVDAINDLYRQKRALTARAILPPQEIADGVVQIELIEGRLGTLTVTGNRTTREGFIRGQVRLREGEPVDLSRLEQDLLRFNAVYDARIRALLKPGREFGTTDFTLTVVEPNRFEGTIYSDNTGRDETGKERGGFTVAANSVLGRRDRLSLGGVFADGTQGFNVSYDLPVGRRGTRVRISFDRSDVDVEDGALAALNIEGDSEVLAFVVTHPFLVRKACQLSAFTGYNVKSSGTRVSGVEILTTEVRSAILGVNYLHYDARGYWYAQSVLTQGFDKFGGDREFLKSNSEFSRIHFLSGRVYVLLRTSLQFSDEPFLPSSEQFQMGGLTTVRGYREGILIGDAGYYVNAELHFPIRFTLNNKDFFRNRLNGFLFADQGGTIAVKDNDDDNTLVSAGAGFNVRINKYLNGRFVAGFPVKDDLRTDENDVRFHFYIEAQF